MRASGLIIFLTVAMPLAAEQYFWFRAADQEAVAVLIDEYHAALDSAERSEQQVASLRREIQDLESAKVLPETEMHWEPDPVATSYLVLVETPQGKEVLRKKVEENFVKLQLKPGKYRMRVAGIGPDGSQGELSDPVPLNVVDRAKAQADKKKEELQRLEKENKTFNDKKTKLLAALRKNAVSTTSSPQPDRTLQGELIVVGFSNGRFGPMRQFRGSTMADKGDRKGLALAPGAAFFYSLRDRAIDRFDHGWGGALELALPQFFRPWLTPFFEAAVARYQGNARPLFHLTHYRFALGALVSYSVRPQLELSAGLSVGVLFLGFFNDARSESYATLFLAPVVRARWQVWRDLSLLVGLVTIYQADKSRGLFYFEPRFGVQYAF
ncbi:MAG: hypothetical protein N2Z22_10145 [Turneriella sp.]|nr:hypothetical protein [Turneriella sp.]